jgi:predicted Zn-dependent peptidase
MAEFNRKVLENGLVVLHEKRDIPVSTIMLGTRFGAAYETEEKKGIAHFIEHMCFKGTEKRTQKQISGEVENLGAVLNAFTHEELTAYYCKLPSDKLKKGAEVIFDIFFNPIFPEDEIKKESQVICEEIKMYNDSPREHVLEKIKEELYEKPFGMFIAGTQDLVKSFTRKDFMEIHEKFYVPENSILCVVGNNSFEEVLEIAERFVPKKEFGNFEKPEIKIIKKISESSEKRPNLSQTNLAIGVHFPLGGDKDVFTSRVFYTILGQGLSSKLFQEVREKRGLVYTVKAEAEAGKSYGYLLMRAGTDNEKELEVRKVCVEEFKKMSEISEQELEVGKERVIGNIKVERESSDGAALELILAEISGVVDGYVVFEDEINKVTLDDIKKLADKSEFAYFSLGPQ